MKAVLVGSAAFTSSAKLSEKKPTNLSRMSCSSSLPALNRYWIMPATSAISVPGRIGIQRLATPTAVSDRCGSTTTMVASGFCRRTWVSRYCMAEPDIRVLAGLLPNSTMFLEFTRSVTSLFDQASPLKSGISQVI